MSYAKAMKHDRNPRKWKITPHRIRGNHLIFGKPTTAMSESERREEERRGSDLASATEFRNQSRVTCFAPLMPAIRHIARWRAVLTITPGDVTQEMEASAHQAMLDLAWHDTHLPYSVARYAFPGTTLATWETKREQHGHPPVMEDEKARLIHAWIKSETREESERVRK